jgi:PKD repeat protein
VSRSWDFGDGSGTSTATNPNYSYGSPGVYDVTLTVTDDGDASDPDTQTVTAGAVAPADLHVGDLDAEATSGGKGGKWNVVITIPVDDANHDPVNGATVDGTWSGGVNGSDFCVSVDGSCKVSWNNINRNAASVTFSVDDVSRGSDDTYQAVEPNHDFDAVSGLTFITVFKPP